MQTSKLAVASATLWSSMVLADSANLKIEGVIKPSACGISFAGDGLVDFGELKAADMNHADWTDLPGKRLDYSIACTAPTRVAMRWTDNRDGSSAVDSTAAYGLGLHRGEKIGASVINYVLPAMQADGAEAVLYRRDTAEWFPVSGLAHHYQARFGVNADPVTGPAAHQTYAGAVMFMTRVVPLRNLDLSEPVTIDGSATLSLEYL